KHPDYSAFKARRDAEVASGVPRTRWASMTTPAYEAGVLEAERAIGHSLPASYRRFLAEKGSTKLIFYLGKNTVSLTFVAAVDLPRWGETVHRWMTRAGDLDGEHARDWVAKFGVDRKALWSVATTWDNSNALLISLASDATYGRCYLWHHEEGYNL